MLLYAARVAYCFHLFCVRVVCVFKMVYKFKAHWGAHAHTKGTKRSTEMKRIWKKTRRKIEICVADDVDLRARSTHKIYSEQHAT